MPGRHFRIWDARFARILPSDKVRVLSRVDARCASIRRVVRASFAGRGEPVRRGPGRKARRSLAGRTVPLAVALVSLAAVAARAADFKPAVIYGNKSDRSFNEAVYNGAQRFAEETGIAVMEFQVANEAQRRSGMELLIQRGATALLAAGFPYADAIDGAAENNPDVLFGIIDAFWLDRPNLRQYSFKEHEGSYLVGVAAATKSRSGIVGFVGGMDSPLIRKFACGYVQGVKSVGPDVAVLQDMTGATRAAWNDPAKGGELARSQIGRGADVVYHAAGATGLGVIEAAADAGKLAIGVDTNQNRLAPGKVLTSMVKRVDIAAYRFFKDVLEGRFSAGVERLGLAEGGVDWAVDEHNRALVAGEIEAAVAAAREAIVSGRIAVHDYQDDSLCPY